MSEVAFYESYNKNRAKNKQTSLSATYKIIASFFRCTFAH